MSLIMFWKCKLTFTFQSFKFLFKIIGDAAHKKLIELTIGNPQVVVPMNVG